MLKVWGRTNSVNVQKVMWAVAELDLPHERLEAGGAFGQVDTPEYGRMNPNRLVPVVEDGDAVIWESNAIVRYLAARYGAGSLWPQDPAERALSDRWMDWQLATLQPVLGVIFWNLIRTPEERRDMAAVDAAVTKIGPLWQILEAHLAAGRDFVGGSTLTIGDIPLGCAYWRYRNLDVAKPGLPAVERWYARLEPRPGYRANVMLPLT